MVKFYYVFVEVAFSCLFRSNIFMFVVVLFCIHSFSFRLHNIRLPISVPGYVLVIKVIILNLNL